jgi:hypothetical protein
MKLLFVAVLLGAILLGPFVALKKPWALRLWQRIRLLFYIYVLAIVISAVVLLVSHWNDFYG